MVKLEAKVNLGLYKKGLNPGVEHILRERNLTKTAEVNTFRSVEEEGLEQ